MCVFAFFKFFFVVFFKFDLDETFIVVILDMFVSQSQTFLPQLVTQLTNTPRWR